MGSADDCFAPGLDEPLEVTARAVNYNAWIFERARPYTGRRVLDLGAGIGTFTALAAHAGLDVVALEPHPEFAAALRERFGAQRNVTVHEGTIESLEQGAFDSVLCFNVLEHIAEDALALAAARERLAPGGRLLLLVPAHQALFSAYDRRTGHRRRYEKGHLGRLLAGTGFEVEELRYVNPVGALGWLIGFKLRPRRKSFPSGSYGAFDRLVPILRPLDRLPLPFGLSLWAVARAASAQS